MARLLATVPGLMFSVSYTTRKPRGHEVDGESYHFVAREDFEAMIARDEFLEWAQVFGNYYGTHRGILEAGPRRRPGPGTRHRRARCETIERSDSRSRYRLYPGPLATDSGRAGFAPAAKTAKK